MTTFRKGIAGILASAMCIATPISALAVDQESVQSASIQAAVPSASSTYYVEIPESMGLGTLDAQSDFQQDYTIGVTFPAEGGKERVTISADADFPMTLQGNTSHQLTCHNTFESKTFTESGTAQGSLKIYKSDIEKAKQGRYSGTLHFYISHEQENPTDQPSLPDLKPNPSPATPKPAPNPPQPSASLPPQPTGDETVYYSAGLSLRKSTNFNDPSMSNALFYNKADITVKGDSATLTLYVIDPVPKFPDEGTPLKDVIFQYKGKKYTSTVQKGKEVMKHFNAAPGFIETSGEYRAVPLTVTLPTQAIWDSQNGALMSSAYVSAVMHVTQEFYVVLENLQKISGPAAKKPAVPGVNPLVDGGETTGTTTMSSGSSSMGQSGNVPTNETSAEQTLSYKIDTKLFPQVLEYIALTTLAVGGGFVILICRQGKDR